MKMAYWYRMCIVFVGWFCVYTIVNSHNKDAKYPLNTSRNESHEFDGFLEPPYRHKGLHRNGLKVEWLVHYSRGHPKSAFLIPRERLVEIF